MDFLIKPNPKFRVADSASIRDEDIIRIGTVKYLKAEFRPVTYLEASVFVEDALKVEPD